MNEDVKKELWEAFESAFPETTEPAPRPLDLDMFVAGLSEQFCIPLSDVARTNLTKLAERKKNGTIITHTDH